MKCSWINPELATSAANDLLAQEEAEKRAKSSAAAAKRAKKKKSKTCEEEEAPVRPEEHISLAEVGDVRAALPDAEGGDASARESTIGGETTCIVCFAGEKSHLAAPCGHQCVCGPCSSKMESCPYCRAPVVMWVSVHVV